MTANTINANIYAFAIHDRMLIFLKQQSGCDGNGFFFIITTVNHIPVLHFRENINCTTQKKTMAGVGL